MSVLPSLLPRALPLLWLFVPGVVLFGWVLARALVEEPRVRRLLAPGLGAVAWILVTQAAGRAIGGFAAAVTVGTVAPGVAGYVLGTQAFRAGGGDPFAPRRYSRWMWITMALGTALLFRAAWDYCFHDELGATAHLSMISEMHRGIFPPRNLTLPQFEMPYHYSCDVFAAFVGAILPVSVAHALDIFTLASFAYSWCLFWALGVELYGKRGGPVVAFLVLLGGGYPTFCLDAMNEGRNMAGHLLAVCKQDGLFLNPTTLTYFFQHAWGVGFPLLGVMGLVLEKSAIDSPRHLAPAVAVLLALYLGQFAVFTATLPILAATFVLCRAPVDWRRRIVWLAALPLVLVLARPLGGFFAGTYGGSSWVKTTMGIVSTLDGALLWNLRSFGPLLVGLVGLRWFRRESRAWLYFALCAVGGLLVCNFLKYAKSWDIVKYATLSAVGLGVLGGGVVVRWFGSPRPIARVAATLTLVAAGLSAAAFDFVFTVGLDATSENFFNGCPAPIAGPNREAALWLRSHMAADDVMYRRSPAWVAYLTEMGIAGVWIGTAHDYPFPPEVVAAREALLANPPRAPEEYRRQHIRYFVIEADDPMAPIVTAWERDGVAKQRATFPPLRILELP